VIPEVRSDQSCPSERAKEGSLEDIKASVTLNKSTETRRKPTFDEFDFECSNDENSDD